MRDLIESFSVILKQNLGIELDPIYTPYVIVFGAAILPLLGMYRWLLRQFGNVRALSSELEAVTRIIREDTRPEFDRLLRDFSIFHTRLESNLTNRLETISIALRSTHSVESRPEDTDVEAEPAIETTSRKTRLAMAESVREMVLDRWLTGRVFRRDIDDPNAFEYYGTSPSGELIYLYLQTPYRQKLGIDGRLPYTLEIWVNKYKQLNFEWDIEGNYALRGFKKGDWIEDVATWNMTPRTLENEIRQPA
jgi:hypothetical protein